MTTKVRKQIYLEPDQDALLKRLSSESGLTEAEIIRQAIDRHAQTLPIVEHHTQAWETERAFILRRMQQPVVAGGRTWRREDLYER